MWDVVLFVGLWLLNLAISWFNARQCGRAWAVMSALGGWYKFVLWCATIMTAIGFTWCILVLEVFVGVFLGLPPNYGRLALELGYVIIIFPLLGIGLVIMIYSWQQAFRNGGYLNYGFALWNTYAQVQNTMDAFEHFGDVFKHVVEFIGAAAEDSKERLGLLVVLLLVAVAFGGGIALTWVLVLKYGANQPLPDDLAELLQDHGEERSR
jgi:hypothetical protein